MLVARGVYEGPFALVSGVNVFGGYRPDFRDRDLELYPVLIESSRPGEPVVTCAGVTAVTRFEGFTLAGSDATTPGAGSTTLYSDVCGPDVVFSALTILAGRGAPGERGDDSSDNLADWGLSSLGQLDGVNGADGRPASTSACPRVRGGVGGAHLCRAADVSGGGGGDGTCPDSGCVNGRACGNAGCTDFTVGGVCDLDAALRVAVANPAAGPGRGPAAGAAGELTYDAPTNRGICNFCDDNPTLPRNGGIGGDAGEGGDGMGGLGCSGAPMLDARVGILRGGAGTDGTPGTDGGGGGGGTAGAGYDVIGGTTGACDDRSGGAGGGGGSGGCGAPAADGGTGGGTSAGVIVRLVGGSRGPSFEDVRVVTASGGRGGDGGVGASGGSAGRGGLGGPAAFWCARTGGRGGDGGRGGAGGGGGGGCGGSSYGVAVVGGASTDAYVAEILAAVDVDTVGVGGPGGSGGFSPAGAGTDGTRRHPHGRHRPPLSPGTVDPRLPATTLPLPPRSLETSHARPVSAPLRRVQSGQLRQREEQADDAREVQDEEVLQGVPQAHHAQGSEDLEGLRSRGRRRRVATCTTSPSPSGARECVRSRRGCRASRGGCRARRGGGRGR